MAGGKITSRQKAMMKFIEEYILDHEYPPTIRDICDGCNISSTSVVDYNLNRLQEMGHIRRDSKAARGLSVLVPLFHDASRVPSRSVFGVSSRQDVGVRDMLRIPIWGSIAAGDPISVPDAEMAPPEDGNWVEVARDMLRVSGDKPLFAMRVKGLSMIDALINNGDIVIFAKQDYADRGEMVAAWLKEEQQTTLKRFYPEGAQIRLQPENETMAPIYSDASNVEIKGKVMMVIRRC